MVELVIFDCDGVLVDTERLAFRIQTEHLAALGLTTDFDSCVRDFLGIGMSTTLDIVAERLGHPIPQGWKERLDREVRAAFERELEPVEGVVDALARLRPMTCIASSGSHEKMRLTLGLTGLYDHFRGRIFSADEVTRGKPAPDLFLHAAEAMGTDPDCCVVVEDSPAGVAAARSAGMKVLAFSDLTPPDSLREADAIFTDMRDLPPLVESLLV
jgi:HAD superfamily hydrolase (TIGR01509 family)